MKTLMVRYKTAAQHAETNAALVRSVFDELRRRAPAAFHYAVYRLEDGVSYVHLAMYEGESPLPALPAFKDFQRELKQRCLEEPVFMPLSAIDAYAWVQA